jgi:hypothetical protein
MVKMLLGYDVGCYRKCYILLAMQYVWINILLCIFNLLYDVDAPINIWIVTDPVALHADFLCIQFTCSSE